MSVRFIHTADVHLGMSFSNAKFGLTVGIKRRQEIKETFLRLLDECVEMNTQLLLISGDLFEEDHISISDLKDIKNRFATLVDTQIIICAGNHDPIVNELSSYNLINWSDNVYVLSTEMERIDFEDLGVAVYGFSWSTKEMDQYNFETLEIEDTSKFNILMLHGDAYNESQYLPLNMTELIGKGFDYIALGHIHKADDNQYRWAYPGSLEPLDFSEVGDHGYVEGLFDGESMNVNFRPFAKRTFIHKAYEINENMSFEEIKNMIIEDIRSGERPESFYRATIKGVRDTDVVIDSSIIKEAVEQVAYFSEIIDDTIMNYDLDRIKKDNQGNIIEKFVLRMEEKGIDNPVVKDALYEGLYMLLKEQVS